MPTNRARASHNDATISLIHKIRGILHGLSEAVLGHATYDVLTRILQDELVCAAHSKLLKENHGKITQARIGLMTGIGPEAIRRVLCTKKQEKLPPLTIH